MATPELKTPERHLHSPQHPVPKMIILSWHAHATMERSTFRHYNNITTIAITRPLVQDLKMAHLCSAHGPRAKMLIPA